MRTNEKARFAGMLSLLFLAAGCDRLLPPRLTVPTQAQADSVVRAHGIKATVRVDGNVVELSVAQAPAQLRHGGTLWAKVGPYIYLFSPATPALFDRFKGVAAVRARTHVREQEVARAELVRDTMRAGDWREANNLLAHALREGTSRPALLEDLVRWGERFTTYSYSTVYVPRAQNRTP